MKILFMSSLQRGSLGYSFMNSIAQLGHELIFIDYRGRIEKEGTTSFNTFLEKAQDEVDLIFVLKGDGVNPELIKGCPKVLFYPDSTERYRDDILLYKGYDKVFMSDPNLPEETIYVPVGIDPTYTPRCNDWNPEKHIVFPATGREDRVEWIKRLHKRYGIEVYGNGWCKDAPYWKGDPVYYQDLSTLCSKSLWMFNLVSGVGVNSRVFETLYMSGAVLISQYNEELARMFKNRTHLYMFKNIEELYDILDNPPSIEEMNKVREAGRKEVLEKHMMIYRMKFMLQECEKLL